MTTTTATTATTVTLPTSFPPPYAKDPIELSSITSSPPPYQPSSSSTFNPTTAIQIQTPGKPWLSLPLPLRPDPIPIFSLSSSGGEPAPLYTSLRPSRSSGSCYLTDATTSQTLSTTTYQCGPSRPPQVRLFLPFSNPQGTQTRPQSSSSSSSSPSSEPEPESSEIQPAEYDAFPLKSTSLLSRTTIFQTRLGTFQWRYASRSERKSEPLLSKHQRDYFHCESHSLLLLERVTRISHGGGGHASKPQEVRTVVGKFVRSKETRTEGSSASSAGNGGRLLLDLAKLDEFYYGVTQGGEGDQKQEQEQGKEETDKEMMTVMAVTTCLVMLKKEVDRRRAQQIMIMAGAASGGA
ncbi:hypothetical protein QBC43DRAFT_311705 [Cladorrhinum sp. PSN259]|nr:hypothetical protein QBC43DRAFT_311705 [Cladorrhinum sp. PSN259]